KEYTDLQKEGNVIKSLDEIVNKVTNYYKNKKEREPANYNLEKDLANADYESLLTIKKNNPEVFKENFVDLINKFREKVGKALKEDLKPLKATEVYGILKEYSTRARGYGT